MKKYIALFLSLALLFGTSALPAEAATDSFTKKTPSVTVKAASYNSAKVSFKKVSGAKGYIIYRKTSKNGKSKKLTTVKSLSYVNKSLNCGSTYYYRVRAYKKTGKKTVYTKYSSWKSVKLSLSASAFTGASANRNKLTVGFKKVSGASGYCLYITKKGGKEKLYYSGSATKKTVTLSYSTAYTLRLAAYRNVNGKKVYSSSVKKSVTMPARPYLNPYDINYGGKVVHMATNGHYMFSKSDYGNFRRRVETFQKLYNCKIAIDDYNFGSFNNDILRSEIPYDIVYLHGSMYLDGAKRGIYEDLSYALKGQPAYNPKNPKAGGIDYKKTNYFEYNNSGIYGVCYKDSLFPYVIFYNKQALSNLGYSGAKDPRSLAAAGKWDWQQLKTMGKAVSNNSRKLLSNSFSARGLMLSFDAPVTVRKSDGKFCNNLTSPNYMASLQLMKELLLGETPIMESRAGNYNGTSSFMNGNTFMYLEESYKILYLTEEVKNSKYFSRSRSNIGVVEMPLPEENTRKAYPTGWLTGFATARGGNTSIAVEWAKFCSAYSDGITDANDWSATDKKYIESLYDGEISFEPANFSNNQTNVLSVAENVVSSVAGGADIEDAVSHSEASMKDCILQTVGY